MRKLSFLVMLGAVIAGLYARSGGDLGVLQSQIPEILSADFGPAEPIKDLVLGGYDPSENSTADPASAQRALPQNTGSGARRIAAPVSEADQAVPDLAVEHNGASASGLQDLLDSQGIADEVDRLALTSNDPARTQMLIAHMRGQDMPDLTILLGLKRYLATEPPAAGGSEATTRGAFAGGRTTTERSRIFKSAPVSE